MQVRLVFFQAAQQALGFGDFFFQCDHVIDGQGIDAASRVYTVPQQRQSASCKLDAGWEFFGSVSGNGELASRSSSSDTGRSVREAPRSLAVDRVFHFASGRSAIFQADTVNSAEPRRSGYRRGPFRRPRRLGLSVRAKCLHREAETETAPAHL